MVKNGFTNMKIPKIRPTIFMISGIFSILWKELIRAATTGLGERCKRKPIN